MKTIPVADATATQLSDYANMNLGLETHFKMGTERILAMMEAVGFNADVLEVHEPEAVNSQMKGQIRKNHKDPAYKKMIDINLQATEEKGGRDPLFVAVNGVGQLVPRGKWVKLAKPYVEALQNAIKYVYDTDKDGKIIGRREVPAHNFQTRIE